VILICNIRENLLLSRDSSNQVFHNSDLGFKLVPPFSFPVLWFPPLSLPRVDLSCPLRWFLGLLVPQNSGVDINFLF
jgi:hypothetical protein